MLAACDCLTDAASRFNQWQSAFFRDPPKNSTRFSGACANRLTLKPFKQNVFTLLMIERFVRGGDVAFCQITSTTCYYCVSVFKSLLNSIHVSFFNVVF